MEIIPEKTQISKLAKSYCCSSTIADKNFKASSVTVFKDERENMFVQIKRGNFSRNTVITIKNQVDVLEL